MSLYLFSSVASGSKLDDHTYCSTRFASLNSGAGAVHANLNSVLVCTQIRPNGCFYNSNDLLKTMRRAGFDLDQAVVHYVTNLKLKQLSVGEQFWDLHVFIEFRGRIYDASYVRNGVIEPVLRESFLENFLEFNKGSLVRTVPARLHMKVFEKYGQQAPSYFGAGLQTWTLTVPPKEGKWIEAEFPVQPALNFFYGKTP